MTEYLNGDPARLVGPAFWEIYGNNQIPVAAVLVVVALDPDERDTKSTYILCDGQEPLVTHHGMASLAMRRFDRQMEEAIEAMQPDGDDE